jgi:putative tricarboxylic transport membrane protein
VTALRSRLRGDLVLIVLLLVAGLGAIGGGIGYQVTVESGQVGPGFMPVVAGLLITVPAALQLIRTLRPATEITDDESISPTSAIAAEAAAVTDAATADGLDEFGRSDSERGRAVFLIFVLIGAAVLLTELVGLLISLGLMVFVLYTLVEKHAWWKGLIAGASTFLFGLIVFKTLLQVALPTGLLDLV